MVEVGYDVNVIGFWLEGIIGKNVIVVIVDDGLDMYSDDLKDNYYVVGFYDFNDKMEELKFCLLDDRYGICCVGEVVVGRNIVCGVGVVYDVRIFGQCIFFKLILDVDEVVVMNYDFDYN